MYKINQKLGEGAFGEVYHLKVADKDEYALKVVSTYKLVHALDRKVDAEAKLMTKLCHPHLVQCCAYFMMGQQLYLVTELCKYGNLRDYLAGLIPTMQHVPEDKVLLWLGQMADVLRYLHASRIIHRDLKPDNLFLDEQQNFKVGDLGIARELDYTNQKLKSFIGTYLYMSPEILKGKSYTIKADIWSLGCCIHEVMTLSPTFKASSIANLIVKVTQGKIGSMPNLYRPILQELIHRIFTVKPNLRPDATDVLFYVCQIQGRPYTSCRHRPMARLELDTKALCKAVKDFKDRESGFPRPLPMPKKYLEKELVNESLAPPSECPDQVITGPDPQHLHTLFKESQLFLKSKYTPDIKQLQKRNIAIESESNTDFESLVTLYTRAQKVTFTKYSSGSTKSDILPLDINPDDTDTAKNARKLFDDPSSKDAMMIKV